MPENGRVCDHNTRGEDHMADCYREHLHSFDDDLLDQVASLGEWSQFKIAVQRWIADHDTRWDEIAIDQEHDRER